MWHVCCTRPPQVAWNAWAGGRSQVGPFGHRKEVMSVAKKKAKAKAKAKGKAKGKAKR